MGIIEDIRKANLDKISHIGEQFGETDEFGKARTHKYFRCEGSIVCLKK